MQPRRRRPPRPLDRCSSPTASAGAERERRGRERHGIPAAAAQEASATAAGGERQTRQRTRARSRKPTYGAAARRTAAHVDVHAPPASRVRPGSRRPSGCRGCLTCGHHRAGGVRGWGNSQARRGGSRFRVGRGGLASGHEGPDASGGSRPCSLARGAVCRLLHPGRRARAWCFGWPPRTSDEAHRPTSSTSPRRWTGAPAERSGSTPSGT